MHTYLVILSEAKNLQTLRTDKRPVRCAQGDRVSHTSSVLPIPPPQTVKQLHFHVSENFTAWQLHFRVSGNFTHCACSHRLVYLLTLPPSATHPPPSADGGLYGGATSLPPEKAKIRTKKHPLGSGCFCCLFCKFNHFVV